MSFVLTDSNYYSQEANRAYWSASMVKSFLDCPARSMAELNGEWTRPPSTALMVGSYVDAAFEGDDRLERFKLEHPELFKRDGSLRAEYVKADEMIERAKSDPVFISFMEGEKQTIKTGKIDGVPFKIKMDVYAPGKRIVDLKTAKDMKPGYKPGQGRLDFASMWNWPLQMAIYQYIEENNLPCYLAVITKEDPPAIEIIQIEQGRMDAELEFLKEKLPYLDAIKQGIIEPDRCEDCAYCRASRKLSGPRTLEEFNEIGGNSIE